MRGSFLKGAVVGAACSVLRMRKPSASMIVALAVLLVALSGVGMAATGGAGSVKAMRAEIGKLTFHGEFAWSGQTLDCPAGVPDSVSCKVHRGSRVVPGLGTVTEKYFLLHEAGTGACQGAYAVIGLRGTLTVERRGTIEFEAAASPDCLLPEQRVTLHFPSVTITGGSGIYAGASGTGTLTKLLIPGTSGGAHGTDTWDGSLLVAGLAFDTTAPVLRGAITKTVVGPRGAKLVRVTYRVSATDETDGAVPASCIPRTGSRFKLGRTAVNCSASDESGNTASARFTVTVRARR